MAEEVINVIVIDASIDAALMKLSAAKSAQRTLKTEGLYGFVQDLPAIKREQRLIITQIPVMRQILATIFRIKMIQRAQGIPIPYTGLAIPGGVVGIAATLIYLVRTLNNMKKQLDRLDEEYERMIRRYTGWTKEEYAAVGIRRLPELTTTPRRDIGREYLNITEGEKMRYRSMIP